MSIKAMVYYLDNSPLTGNEKLALVILADYANDEGECYPGHKRIAHRLNMTVSGARKILYRLRDAGELEILNEEGVHTETGNTNRYRLLKYIESIQPETVSQPGQGRVSQPGQGRVSQPGQGRVSPAKDTDPSEVTVSMNHQIEESASHSTHRQPSKKVAPKKEDPFFELMCKITGIDWKTISAERRGQLNQARSILLAAGYTPEDLTKFWNDVWVKDWRYKKNKSKPTIQQLRDEIGKVRATNVIPNSGSNDTLPEYDPSIFDTSNLNW